MQNLNHLKHFLGAALLTVATAIPFLKLQAADTTNQFGFTGPEIFPIDSQISLLRSPT